MATASHEELGQPSIGQLRSWAWDYDCFVECDDEAGAASFHGVIVRPTHLSASPSCVSVADCFDDLPTARVVL